MSVFDLFQTTAAVGILTALMAGLYSMKYRLRSRFRIR